MMNTDLISVPENTPVVITTYKGSTFEAVYRGFVPTAERYEFGIRITPNTETTVLFDKDSIKTYRLQVPITKSQSSGVESA